MSYNFKYIKLIAGLLIFGTIGMFFLKEFRFQESVFSDKIELVYTQMKFIPSTGNEYIVAKASFREGDSDHAEVAHILSTVGYRRTLSTIGFWKEISKKNYSETIWIVLREEYFILFPDGNIIVDGVTYHTNKNVYQELKEIIKAYQETDV